MTRFATPSRPKATVRQRLMGGFGEILITLGILLILFVGWELWWTNLDADRAQSQVTSEFLKDLTVAAPNFSDAPEKNPNQNPNENSNEGDEQGEEQSKDFGPAPITAIPGGETFGIFYIPRFGSNFAHPVTNGVGMDVLNTVGIGHYPDTQSPGELGNFAVAAHRQTHGQVFWDIDKFQDGDKIYLQTRKGFYTYEWRSTEIVSPSAGDVLFPVPHRPGVKPTTSILTMTSCHPPFTTRMRIIAYSELESWRPADAGAPAEIADLVQKTMGN
ncbi:class E sortase [Paeniglutamicibacter sp. Y32M11]|uniref:class E sortase n=1 Tax=Paeniglutamicibacter sp. Y32M11 TaxID=2853258 RepID=UPI001C5281BB|nr:class E sortase [Paeniglutamicibacter sp. Y32M11]QXQ10411.1 class E sortase [Paeniglutamicibacter sp. Y32M11]